MQRGWTELGVHRNRTGEDLKELMVLQGLPEHNQGNTNRLSVRLGGDGNQSDKFRELRNI